MFNGFSRGSIKFILLWLTSFGFFIGIIFLKYITVYNYKLATIYFILLSIIIWVFQKRLFKSLISITNLNKLGFILLSIIFNIFVYWFCINYLTPPTSLINNNAVSFLILDNFFLITKPFDVLLQQTFVIILVLRLSEFKFSLEQVILITSLIFGISHLFIIYSMTLPLALYFTAFAIMASTLFPYSILKIQDGWVYSYMAHLAFYSLSALLFWVIY